MGYPYASGDVLTAANLNAFPGAVTTAETTFSGVSSLTLTNCFNSNYRNYRLIMNVYGTSAGATANLQFRSGGTTDTSANYNRVGWYYLSAGSLNNLSTTGATFAYLAAFSNTNYSPVSVDIFTPNEATQTRMLCSAGQSDSNLLLQLHHYVTTSTAYDSIVLSPSAGTFSGHVLVMGYNGT